MRNCSQSLKGREERGGRLPSPTHAHVLRGVRRKASEKPVKAQKAGWKLALLINNYWQAALPLPPPGPSLVRVTVGRVLPLQLGGGYLIRARVPHLIMAANSIRGIAERGRISWGAATRNRAETFRVSFWRRSIGDGSATKRRGFRIFTSIKSAKASKNLGTTLAIKNITIWKSMPNQTYVNYN